MPSLISELRYGRVVEAVFTDRNGVRKPRTAVVLTPTDEIKPGSPIVLMAITSTFPDPPPAGHVPLPWHNDPRRTPTRLGRRSAAVVHWLETTTPEEVTQLGGDVPPKYMNRIQHALQNPG